MEHPHNTMKYLTQERMETMDLCVLSKHAKRRLKKKLIEKKRLSVKELRNIPLGRYSHTINLFRAMLSRKQEWLFVCALVGRVLGKEEKPKKRLREALKITRESVRKGKYKETRHYGWGEMARAREKGNFRAAHVARMVALAGESFGYIYIFEYLFDYEMLCMEFPGRDGKGGREKDLIRDMASWILHGRLAARKKRDCL